VCKSFNGKPQALLPNFAYACGSPLNENTKIRNRNNSPPASYSSKPIEIPTLFSTTVTAENSRGPSQLQLMNRE